MELSEAIARAQLEYRSGDIAAAQATLQTHLATNPGDGAARIELSRVLLMQRDAAGAEAQARVATEDPRVMAWAQAALARIIGLDTRRAAEALDWAQRAVTAQQTDADIQLVYAARLADVGRVAESVAVFERAISLSPPDPLLRARAHTSAAVALVNTTDGRATARRHATTALQLDPSNALAADVARALESGAPVGATPLQRVLHEGRQQLAQGNTDLPAARIAVRGALARSLAVTALATLLGASLSLWLGAASLGARAALITGTILAPVLLLAIALVLLRSLGTEGTRRLPRVLRGFAEWFAVGALAIAVVNAIVVAVTGMSFVLLGSILVLLGAEITLILSTRSERWQSRVRG